MIIIYQIYFWLFQDFNGDGIGDLKGIFVKVIFKLGFLMIVYICYISIMND